MMENGSVSNVGASSLPIKRQLRLFLNLIALLQDRLEQEREVSGSFFPLPITGLSTLPAPDEEAVRGLHVRDPRPGWCQQRSDSYLKIELVNL